MSKTTPGEPQQVEGTDPGPGEGHEIFDLGDVVLQCGLTLPSARLAFRTYGALNAARDNAVLMPTFFGGQHADTGLMLASGRALDPSRYFIIVPDMLGDGLSSSPSNTPSPFDGPGFPNITVFDNVTCQHRLLIDHLGVDHLRLVVGFSMGAQQAFQWGSLYPDMVASVAPICGSAKTSTHNRQLLEGARLAMTRASGFQQGRYEVEPVRAIQAFCRVYSSLIVCSEFYREGAYTAFGLASPEDLMRFFEGFFRGRDANDLLAQLWTWQHADISANNVYNGELADALGAITARTIILTSDTDLLFTVGDSQAEVRSLPNAELRSIPSTWGHLAGFGANPADNEFIDTALGELLDG